MRRTPRARAVALALLIGAAAAVAPRDLQANGRFPATTNVRLDPSDSEVIYLPVTFGLLTSTDAGETFRWVCETAIGYGGIYDPDYAVTADGEIYATTFEGLRVSRDRGCSWTTINGIPETAFLSEVEIGPDGRIWAITSTGQGPNDVYVSADGTDFVSSNLLEAKAWWVSIRTTPANGSRIYVSGFLPQQGEASPAQALLRRSDDGGMNWTVLPVDGFTFGDLPRVYVVGVSPVDANIVFARVVDAVEPTGDALYRSADGGMTWEKKLDFGDLLSAFHIRPDGQTVIAATVNGCPGDANPATKGCVQISHDGGDTWQLAAQQPRLACIDERSDGTLFGCGANWEPDNFALGRSSDGGENWEKVYRLSETAGPLECPATTEQAECAALVWPGVCDMLGICSTPGGDAGPSDAGVSGGGDEEEGSGSGGCCRVSGGGDASWVPGLAIVLLVLAWRGRRRS